MVRALAMAMCGLALVVCYPVAGAAEPPVSSSSSSRPVHKPAPKAKSAPTKKRAGHKGKARASLRVNMPHGWAWPPNSAMKQAGQRCLRDLDRLGVAWKAGPATGKIATPVIVDDMTFGGVKLVARYGKGPHVMDCHLARALARFVGPALRNMKVTEVRFGQLFKYRQVAGKKGVLSRHALGLAMDVYAFVTADGETHVVEGGYVDGDEVLLEIEERVTDTGAFRMLLTPGNDPARHYDHYHFEARTPGDKVVTKPVRARSDDLPLAEVLGSRRFQRVLAPSRAPVELEGPPVETEGPPYP